MSERNRDFRRRIPASRRGVTSGKSPRPSPSPSGKRRIRPVEAAGKVRNPSDKDRVLKRSKSEPSLWKPIESDEPTVAAAEDAAAEEEEDEGVLFRPRTCTDIFTSPDHSTPRSPANCAEGYDKEAKVVVNVTVEGSVGPIRTMVKLGSKIEDIISLVVKKYNEEGRTPRLEKDSVSTFQLHQSHFSLESIRKSDLIGDVGSRNFYLRKCSTSDLSDDTQTEKTSASSNQLDVHPLPFMSSAISRKIKRIMRRTRKVWRIFGCISCAG
ncbi:uncharacterized protein At4g22758 [Andrographis paniculata]|uniref:uncharacterized protein At4g22758 n=1 Tax=Andrographis paniculata TaxID=175694 RepID=UPI0021E8D629|nr:uncharacterized protein At4g22758 [Andrographis paniculata]